MNRFLKGLCLLISVAAIAACTTSPTGRNQLNLFSGGSLNSLGADSFAQMKQEEPVSEDPELNAYVQCIANSLIEILPEEYAGETWEVAVFESDTVNAFALPGGYIGFYVGMLKLAENEHQVAAVMGHEIGHVMAEHSSERMSTNLLLTGALIGADIAISDRSAEQRAMIMAALGIGAQIGVMLPYSRTHENEADHIGIELMAKAGFDPREAPRLWEVMSAEHGDGPPELLSTHPSPSTRIERLNEMVPGVMPDYEAHQNAGTAAHCHHPEFSE